ncbi:MAG: glycine cleavage system protein GcvH [Candidatus Heimdallarchaeota archaeon]
MSYKVMSDYKYLPEHDWAKLDGEHVLVGVTDYAQKSLKDVVYVELPSIGNSYGFKEVFGAIESVKAASELFLPIGGEIVSVNEAVNDNPEKVNEDPYGTWLVKIKPSSLDEDWSNLMNAEEYKKYIEELED